MNDLNKYINNYFEEKEIPSQIFNIEHKGVLHLVENEVVIELIKQAPDNEKKVIRETLQGIDFANGNVNHYLKFLAQAYIEANY